MNKRRFPILWELYVTFCKIGLFTFGGGYAMISLITGTCVEEKKWLTQEEMLNLTVVAESTPGPIAINCATFVGCRRGGIWGSVASTLGVVTPSFLIIYLISLFLENILDIPWIAHAFQGIQVCVGILIVDVGLKMLKSMKKKPLPVTVMALSLAALVGANLLGFRLSSIVLMLLAGLLALGVQLASRKGGQL